MIQHNVCFVVSNCNGCPCLDVIFVVNFAKKFEMCREIDIFASVSFLSIKCVKRDV